MFQQDYGRVKSLLRCGGNLLLFKSIAYIAHGFDELVRWALNLAPQPFDVYIYRPVAAVIIVAPDFVEQ